MNLTKLDNYEVCILPGVIRVKLGDTADPQSADILSEISRSDDNIYYNSEYFEFLGDSRILEDSGDVYLELDVVHFDNRAIL